MTNSKKDSELRKILIGFNSKCIDIYESKSDYRSAEQITADLERALEKAIFVIESKYITKEESDRRVLEGRIDILEEVLWSRELTQVGEVVATSKVAHILSNVRRGVYTPNRIAELRELLKGDKDVVH